MSHLVQNKSPKLRFREFTNEWEIKKLGTIAEFYKGRGISKNDIVQDGNTEAIRYGELYTRYGEVIKETYSRTNLDPKSLILSHYNDVIIPASGESSIDIATASCVLKNGVALSGDINIIRTKGDGVFLAYYLNNKKKYDIAKLAQGNSVVHLYSSSLKALPLNLPSIKEQKKIAEFFEVVDGKISALQNKKTLLENYKKNLAQAIFSQKIRFKTEGGNQYPEWEEKDLKEVAERVTSRNKNGIYKNVLTNSAIRGVVSQTDYFDKDIANQNNLTNYSIVKTDDFVYNPRISAFAPVGPIKRNHFSKGLMSPLYSIFRFKEANLDFFENYFETSYWHEYMKSVANSGARHDRMNITNADLYKLPLPFPCEEEQQKIADFLTSIDNKINLTKKELEQAKRFKQGLLQQLFV